MEVQLTLEEIQEIEALIHRELDGLIVEMHHTRTAAYKERLRQHREALDRILDKLGQPQKERCSPCMPHD
jgi:predicted metallo-beta-lactamase superfamily hydrolase